MMKKLVRKIPTLTGTRYSRIRDPVADGIELLSVPRHHNPGAAPTSNKVVSGKPKFIAFVSSKSEERKTAKKRSEPQIPLPPFPDPKDNNQSAARRLFSLCCPTGLVLGNVSVVRLSKNSYCWQVNYANKGLGFPSPADFDVQKARSILQSHTPAGGVLTTLVTVASKRDVRWCACYKMSTRRSHVREVVRGIVEYLVSRIVPGHLIKPTGTNLVNESGHASYDVASASVKLDLGLDKGKQITVRLKDPVSGVITFEPILSANRLLIPQKVFLGNTDVTCPLFGKTRVLWRDIDALIAGSDTKKVRAKKPLTEQIRAIVREEVQTIASASTSGVDFSYEKGTGFMDLEDKLVYARLSSAANLSLLHEYIIASSVMPSEEDLARFVDFDRDCNGYSPSEIMKTVHDCAKLALVRYHYTKPKYTVDEQKIELSTKGLPIGSDAWTVYFGRILEKKVDSRTFVKHIETMYKHAFR